MRKNVLPIRSGIANYAHLNPLISKFFACLLSVMLVFASACPAWAIEGNNQDSSYGGSTQVDSLEIQEDEQQESESEDNSETETDSFSSKKAQIQVLSEGEVPESNPTEQPTAQTEIKATCTIIGIDAEGNDQVWAQKATYTFPITADKTTYTAEDLTKEVFETCVITADSSDSEYGWYINTITSPFDETLTLGWDATTGKYWQLFVDGAASEYGASSVSLNADGSTEILWYYSAWGQSSVDSEGTIIIDKNAVAPGGESDWSGYNNTENGGTVTTAQTPVDKAELSWSFGFNSDGGWPSASELMISNGSVYFAVDSVLYKLNAETGEVENTANLAKTISYTSRPIIADGLIVVPLDGGALQALTADTLTTKWITSEVSDYSQSSCTLTVHNGTVLVGTTDFSTGCIRAFDLETGKLLWSYDNSDECYYWNGGVVVNDTFVMSTQTATFEAINVKTGTVIGSVLSLKELGIDTKINSDLVVDDEGRIYAITRDGVVRILELTTQGLQQTDTIDLGITDIVCTPTILDRTMIVGCPNGLALINLDTKALTRITSLDNGEAIGDVRSTPLVSCQDDKTVVYFTQNKYDGSLYQYVLGESSATCIWEATDSYVQYCDSPIATDKKGNLYYVIDYSYLVAFAAGKTSNSSDESGSDDGPNNGSNSSGNEEGSNNSDNSSGNSSASASKGAPLSEQGAQMGTAEVSTAELSSDENMEGSTESVSNYSLKKAEGQSEEGSLSSDMLPFVGIAGGVVLLGVAAWLLVGKRPGRFN